MNALSPLPNQRTAVNRLKSSVSRKGKDAPLDPAASSAYVERNRRAAIRLAGISKVFPSRKGQPEVKALEDVDLMVPAGGILGIIGPSGAGKSTLLRLVNGLERPSAGQVFLFERDVSGLSEVGWRAERRGIGMIFQHFNLLSSRTVFDNVALPLEIAGTPRHDIDRQVTRLLDLVGLSDKRERYPAELSGGQKQRVGIARALSSEPAILLCDEATSSLDPETTRSILVLLQTINRQLGVTILLITHEIPVIKEICDEVAVIEGGRIVEQGPVFDVLTDPRHPITARFVDGVTSVETPAHILTALVPSYAPGREAVLRIGFAGARAPSLVISQLSARLGAEVNIVAGRIDAIGRRTFGSLIVTVLGEASTLAAGPPLLGEFHLKIESLGYLESMSAQRAEQPGQEASHHVA